MLLDHLYTINSFNADKGTIMATVTINATHPIFEGHFPGQPILPGVCQLQIIKELLEKETFQKLQLQESANCKFLQMIDPTRSSTLTITIHHSIKDDLMLCNGVIQEGDRIFLKMNGVFAQLYK